MAKKENIESILKSKQALIYPIKGYSMLPLLIENRSRVLIKTSDTYKENDVVLFKSGKNSYILHRIYSIKDDNYIILGDNSLKIDVKKSSDILGKMVGYYVDENYFDIESKEYQDYLSDLLIRKKDFFPRLVKEKSTFINERFSTVVKQVYKLIIDPEYQIDKQLFSSLTCDEVTYFTTFFSERKCLHLFALATKDISLYIPNNLSKIIKDSLNTVKLRYLRIDEANIALTNLFNDNHIPFIFLKGSEIRDLYKVNYLRSSNDVDIYVGENNFTKSIELIKEKLGGVVIDEPHPFHVGINLNQYKMHIEIHHDISYHLLDDVKYLLKDPFKDASKDKIYPYKYHMSIEKSYLFHVVHAACHIAEGLNWISMFSDTYLMNNFYKIDKSILKEGKLDIFEKSLFDISNYYFTDSNINDSEVKLLKYLSSPLSMDLLVSQKIKHKNKFTYLCSRIFVKKEVIYHSYPVVDKHKFLLPIFIVVRWFKVFKKGKLSSSLNEVDRYKKLDNDLISALKENGLEDYISCS